MSTEFFEKLNLLNTQEVPFAVATVIRITGSVSAKPGAKSILDSEGNTLYGWVGGGCAEEAVRDAAMDSLKDGQTRIVPLDLDDEVLGVGMPCGGKMDVYVEPYLTHKGDQHSIKKALEGNGPYIGLVASTKRSKLVFQYLLDEGGAKSELKRVHSPAGLDFGGTTPEEIALSIIAEMVSIRRGGTGSTMMEIKQVNLDAV